MDNQILLENIVKDKLVEDYVYVLHNLRLYFDRFESQNYDTKNMGSAKKKFIKYYINKYFEQALKKIYEGR